MNICQINDNFSFKLKGSCGDCFLKKNKNLELEFKKILPENLCPWAYYSIIPYWLSLIQGAWFPWEKNKNEVVCQCPKPQGVVFLIKKIQQPKNIVIQAEVKSLTKSVCPYQYSKGLIFKIGHNNFCPALFPSFWSQFERLKQSDFNKLDCCLKSVSFQIQPI